MKTEPVITIDFLSAQLETHCAAAGISLKISRLVLALMHEVSVGRPLNAGDVQCSRVIAAVLACVPDPEAFISNLQKDMRAGKKPTAEVIDFVAFQGKPPASASARADGCSCPPPVTVEHGEQVFEMDPNCPLHGYPPEL